MLRRLKSYIFRISEGFWEFSIFPEFWQNFERILMCKDSNDSVALCSRISQPCFRHPVDASARLGRRPEVRLRDVVARVPGLKGSIGDRSNHSNFSHQNSVKILSEFRKIHQQFSENFWNLRNSQHFLKYSAKFREIFVRIGAKFDEKVLKTSDFTEI